MANGNNGSIANGKSRTLNGDNAKFIKGNAKSNGRVQLIPLNTTSVNNSTNQIAEHDVCTLVVIPRFITIVYNNIMLIYN